MTISNSIIEALEQLVPRSASSSGTLSGIFVDNAPHQIDPRKAADVYGVPSHSGEGVKIGIIALGGGWKPSDLTASLNRIGITDVPNIEVISVDGTGNVFVNTGSLYTDDGATATMPSFETTLDIYCVAAVVPKANIVLYRGESNALGYTKTMNAAVNDQCDVISTSFAFDETGIDSTLRNHLELSLIQAVAQGTTVFAATGDWGSESTLQNKSVAVTYPASSPNAIGVGGTYIDLDANGNFLSEEAASESSGGVSTLFTAPAWQQGLTYTTYPDGEVHPLTMRGIPDMVTPFGFYVMYFDGELWAANGSSASAPVMAGIAARYVGITGRRLGLLTRDYLYPASNKLFNSILTADNTTSTNLGNDATSLSIGYSLTPGWNPLTGLGSIKGQALLEILDPPPYYGTMKYGLGVTSVYNSGTWNPLKGAWVNQNGTWVPIQKGFVQRGDGNWERIYPTPAGIFTANVSTLTSKFYHRHYYHNVFTVLNTGDYDLTINSYSINDDVSGVYVTNTVVPDYTAYPITLAPGQSQKFDFKIYGNTSGFGSGNIQFVNYTGYLGYSNVSIPTAVTVLPEYAAINVPLTGPVKLTAYEFEGNANSYSYTSPGTYSYTTPIGVSSLTLTLAGGGGGGGGSSAATGSSGYSGHLITGNVSVNTGDIITVYVGGGGAHGAAGASASGGVGGTSTNGYGGGTGSNAGPVGASGSGGGGGAATVVKKNGTIIAVAAGGGGGGGCGNGNGIIYNNDEYGHNISIEYGTPPNGKGQNTGHVGGTVGANGASTTGTEGGGGGGGGGYQGGIAGAIDTVDIDQANGGYSGSDGSDYTSGSFTAAGLANNNGTPSVSGGNGYTILQEHGIVGYAAQTLTIENTGTGANLVIFNIVSQNGYSLGYNVSTRNIGYDFTNFVGNTATFTLAPASLPYGIYNDVITINSTALNAPAYNIPVTVNIIRPNGRAVFEEPGTYSWTVPDHVHRLNMFAVGAGGGGGAGFGFNGGGGGGGGAGAYQSSSSVPVTPGENLTITVGSNGDAGTLSSKVVYPISGKTGWDSFMNNNAVWINSTGVSLPGPTFKFSRVWNAAVSGTYTVTLAADKNAQLRVDGNLVAHSSSYSSEATFTFNINSGNRVIAISVGTSDNLAGGVAATITDPSNNVVWTTRTTLDPGEGGVGSTTTISGSFGTITALGGAAGASATQTVESFGGAGGDSGGGFTVAPNNNDDDSPDGDGGGGDCFTADSLVTMSDGSMQRIKDVAIGDYVYNFDKTAINRVMFIERVLDTNWETLYTPSADIEPFATINHPLYIDGKLSSPGANGYEYPWLGTIEKITPAKVIPTNGQIVYNLWVDGDGTYTVNGYGTTSIVGDGGLIRLMAEQDIITAEEALGIIDAIGQQPKPTLELEYGAYLINYWFGKADIKIINKLMGLLVKQGFALKVIFAVAKLIGKIAYLRKKI